MINFKCPKCDYLMNSSQAGRPESCPRCGNVAIVPASTTTTNAPQALPETTPTDSNKQPGRDEVLWTSKPSHWSYLFAYFAAILVILGSAATLLIPDAPPLLCLIGILGPIIVLIANIDRIRTRYSVTSGRIILRKGIVARFQTEVPISRLREIKFNQGILDRLADVGSFGFATSASSDVEIIFRGVPSPMQLKEIVDSLTDAI